MLKKVALTLFLVACSGDETAPTESAALAAPRVADTVKSTSEVAPTVAPTAAQAPAPATAPSTALPTPPAPSPATASLAWRDRVKADLAALRTSSPQLLTDLTQLAPRTTRAGTLRFTSDAIHDPRAAAVFIDRLARGGDSEQVRAALAEALPRTGGIFADAAVDLFATERSPRVRGVYVFTARRAPASHAATLIKRGFADGAAAVQAEAARSAATHPDGNRFAPELRTALASSDAAVRTEAARSIGILKITDARDALVARLSDASADVRLEALLAIDSLDPAFARTLPLANLAKDEDERISALVSRITSVQPTRQ